MPKRHKLVRLAAVLLVMAVVNFSALFVVPTRSAKADGGDNYPSNWKSNTTWYDTCAGDTWGYCQRWCTSWVAWALHDRNGFNMDAASGLYDMGNASAWKQGVQDAINAGHTSYSINTTPSVGAVAWWSAGWGHVAWVEAVYSSTSIQVEEYNYTNNGTSGAWDQRTITSSGLPDDYLHLEDLAVVC